MNREEKYKDLSCYDLDELLKLKDKQLRIEKYILISIVLIIILLILIFFKLNKCDCCKPCTIDNSGSSQIEPGSENTDSNVNGDGSGTGTSTNGITYRRRKDKNNQSKDTDRKEEFKEYFKLTDSDTEHLINNPFNVEFAPGDDPVEKVYSVEIKHKENLVLYFSLANTQAYNDEGKKIGLTDVLNTSATTVLDYINMTIKIDGDDEPVFDSTFREMLLQNLFDKYIVAIPIETENSTDTVEFNITAWIDENLEDNYSDSTDANCQNTSVGFAFKWWVE